MKISVEGKRAPQDFYFDALNKFLTYDERYEIFKEEEEINDYNKVINDYQNNLVDTMFEAQRSRDVKYKAIDKAESLEKMLKSPYIESAQFDGEYLVLVTKPLKVWLWDWGQYVIKYKQGKYGGSYPSIERLGFLDKMHSIIVPYIDSEFLSKVEVAHPHVFTHPCFGQATNLVLTFWDDYEKGFNYCIQYLLTYYRDGSYLSLPYFLALLGYIKDASAIMKNGNKIAYIIDNKFYGSDKKEIQKSELRSWGCNGKIATKGQIDRFIKNSRYTRRKEAIEQGIKYVSKIRSEFKHDRRRGFEYETNCDKCGSGINDPECVDNKNLCPSCFRDYTEICDECGERHLSCVRVKGKKLCPICYVKVTFKCYRCENRELISNQKIVNKQKICEECYNTYYLCRIM